jgi:uncharacterized membrane protein
MTAAHAFIHWDTLAAIFGMALITYLCRVSGIALAGRLKLGGRALAAFEAIPPAVLTAVIAPTVLVTGPAETIASLVAIAAATRLPMLATVGLGVATVVALRASGL